MTSLMSPLSVSDVEPGSAAARLMLQLCDRNERLSVASGIDWPTALRCLAWYVHYRPPSRDVAVGVLVPTSAMANVNECLHQLEISALFHPDDRQRLELRSYFHGRHTAVIPAPCRVVGAAGRILSVLLAHPGVARIPPPIESQVRADKVILLDDETAFTEELASMFPGRLLLPAPPAPLELILAAS